MSRKYEIYSFFLDLIGGEDYYIPNEEDIRFNYMSNNTELIDKYSTYGKLNIYKT